MAGPSTTTMLSASANPSQKQQAQTTSTSSQQPQPPSGRPSLDRGDGLQPPAPNAGGRNLSASAVSFVSRGPSLNPSPAAPGSFSSDLRSLNVSRAGVRPPDMFPPDKFGDDDSLTAHERTIAYLREALSRELKIKEGSENMLEALNSKKAKQTKEQRQRVEAELASSNQRIKELRQRLTEAQRSRAAPTTPTRSRTDGGLFPGSGGFRSPPSASRSGAGSDADEPFESPTYALTELLQALEVGGMTSDYYVSRANSLVDLFKRHPALKYDLVWPIFGRRMQSLLLSESREVVAAAYRMMRYAITDINSLRVMRSLNTDYLVTWSLIKDRKADVEREQALKFVRAFLDVKDGVREISRAVVRAIAAVAEEPDERLRPICLETLAEILVHDPQLVIASGGLAPLKDALADGSYKALESLTAAFLYLLDSPHRRKFLRPGNELEVLFTAFTDELVSNERFLKQSAKCIASALKTWPGLMTLSMYNFRAIKSMISSMVAQTGPIRETILDLIFSLLRIKPPAWANSFLAGRRLTTYGRVANLRATTVTKPSSNANDLDDEEGGDEQNFVEHYTALLLAVFIKCGLVPALLKLTQDNDNQPLRRKSTLLIGEVLRLASRLLPPSWNSELHLLPELFIAAAKLRDEAHFIATGVIYQISSVNKTLYRTTPLSSLPSSHHALDIGSLDDHPKSNVAVNTDEGTFRQLIIESNVLNSSNYNKWNWEVIQRIIEGPLTNGKRLEEAIKASKFMKRIMSFYRPFKYKFSEVKSSRNSQKYVRAGCSLMHALLQSNEGVKYLSDNKLLRQIAECIAQCDPTSGLTAQDPMFSKDRLADTLCGGYFPMLGVLSGDVKGMQMLDRWRIFNMLYRILDLKQRPDLIKLMLSNFDYSLQGHPRVLLSKALTAGTKEIRIYATNVLRKYATRPAVSIPGQEPNDSKWAIQLLVTQLYDPEIEVCATAVKILEKACNTKNNLEYIVECRPALDHLGEIGAPLLLRFLSTSIGYHYLDGLDYISNEMDDWFLGRNDTYVSVVEASLARAFLEPPQQEDHANRLSVFEDDQEMEVDAHVPPHFYRELTRTEEGCKLLSEKGHFDEFAATIREYGMQSEDPELIVKVKGCLWAVGNVGSMELGAPFLESCDVVEQIIKIAQSHPVMSLRGTAFFVLGLISRSIHGLEILAENGWDSNTNILGHSLGLCIPTDLSQFFSLEPWQHIPVTAIDLPDSQKTEKGDLWISPPPLPGHSRPSISSRSRSQSLLQSVQEEDPNMDNETITSDGFPPHAVFDPDPTNQRILELIVDMSNLVLYRRARAELLQIKAQQSSQSKKGMRSCVGGAGGNAPNSFSQPGLFRKVLMLLECRYYRLADRNMIVGLFDKSVLRTVVYEEDRTGAGGAGRGSMLSSNEEESEMDEVSRNGGDQEAGATRPKAPVDAPGGAKNEGNEAGSDDDDEQSNVNDNDQDRETREQKEDEQNGEQNEHEDDEDEDGQGVDGSGDNEQRAERQRSVSDPSAAFKRRGMFGR